MRDWAWLRAKYGNVSYLEAAGYPKFQLIKVEEMEGPRLCWSVCRTRTAHRTAASRLCLSWPLFRSRRGVDGVSSRGGRLAIHPAGVIQRTENGCTGFGWAVAVIS